MAEDSFSVSISTAELAFVVKELKFGLEAIVERNEAIRAEMVRVFMLLIGTGINTSSMINGR